MSKPDYAFRTSTHLVKNAGPPGVYRTEPGDHELKFTLEAQRIPDELRTPELERAAMAWVIARGGRALNLDGDPRPITPQELDRPAAGPVRRLVSIAPSNAEIVGALGATDLLVGVESSSDFPPEINGLPRLGPDLAVDMEALAALQPDLVLASLTVPGMERNVTALERLGIPYLVLAPRNLAEIRREVERVGETLGREEAARGLLAAMDERLAASGPAWASASRCGFFCNGGTIPCFPRAAAAGAPS